MNFENRFHDSRLVLAAASSGQPVVLDSPLNRSVTTASAAFDALEPLMRRDVEEFWALALSPGLTVLRSEMLARGTVDRCVVHPRDLFRFACISNASALIVAHNHPSGDLEASEQDLLITRNLIRASKLFEIPLVDHLIIANGRFSSFAMKQWCRF